MSQAKKTIHRNKEIGPLELECERWIRKVESTKIGSLFSPNASLKKSAGKRGYFVRMLISLRQWSTCEPIGFFATIIDKHPYN